MMSTILFKCLLWVCSVSIFLIFADSARGQSIVSLNGTNYTLNAHPRVWLDGPGGALTTALQDPTDRAQSSNPAYQGMVSVVNAAMASNVCSTGANTYKGVSCLGANTQYTTGGDAMALIADAATLWWAQGGNVSDPNGYLAYARYGLDHIEDLWHDSTVCQYTTVNIKGTAVTWVSGTPFSANWTGTNPSINTVPNYTNPIASVNSPTSITMTSSAGTLTGATFLFNFCGRNNTNDFNNVAWLSHAWQAFSIVRSQLSNTEISTFANKVLNDNDTSHNGLNATACTPQYFTLGGGSISVSGNVVTGVGTAFTSTLAAGDVMFNGNVVNSATEIGVVYSIASDTSLVLTTSAMQSDSSDANWQFVPPWTPSNCGYIWFAKHAGFASPIIPSQASHYTADYPPAGGSFIPVDHNLVNSDLGMYITIGLALADDDSRAGELLTQSYNYWYTNCYPIFKSGWNGFNQSQESYTGVWLVFITMIPIAIRNSVQSGPDLTPGLWLSRYVPYVYYDVLPGASNSWGTWGDQYPQNAATGITLMRGALEACYITSGATGTLSSECQSMYYYLRSVRSDYSAFGWGTNSGSYLPELYTFYHYNGTATQATYTQYAFKDSDLAYSQCSSMFGSSFCVQNQIWGGILSKSDWSSTASHMLIKTGWDKAGQDHTDNAQQGAFHIYRGPTELLGGDNNGGNGTYNYCNGVQDSMVDLNCTTITAGSYAPVSRWAGPDPTGDPGNRYTYAMIDLTGTYKAAGNAIRVQRHIQHFKKRGSQDYIVTYDDIELSAALPVAPKAYFHYFLNGAQPGTAISFDAASRTVSNVQSGSALSTQFVPVAGVNSVALALDNPDGSYKGGNGKTYRVYMCPSADGATCNAGATRAEWAAVHMPATNPLASLPPIKQIEASAFRVIQIEDSVSPKVAAFAQGGRTYTSATFTSTHSGTGQYLIAGLTPGTYAVLKNGSTLLSNQIVVAGDNTLYFESSSGSFSIARAGVKLSSNLSGNLKGQDVELSAW